MDIPKISEQTAASLTPFEPNPDKVFVAFDGHINSVVCASILKDQGFAVEGCFFKSEDTTEQEEQLAKEMAQKLGIVLITLYIDDMDKADINPSVLFLSLLNDYAGTENISFIASGHNAKIIETNNNFSVVSGEEPTYQHAAEMQNLSQDILEKLCLPNGEFTKKQIQEIAEMAGLL